MTLEELQKFENKNKANNPYFRKIIPVWREMTLFVMNSELKKENADALIMAVKAIYDYNRIIIEDADFKAELDAKIKRIKNLVNVLTDGFTDDNSDEEEY